MRALALLLVAVPAQAQPLDPAPWQGRFDACVLGVDSPADMAGCIGQASRLCMDETEGGHTTLGMTLCNGVETALWDGLLNADWPEHRRWAREADAAEAEVFGDRFSTRAESLLDAQRAWIAHRDAECALDHAVWGSGSMRHVAISSCMVDMTAARVIRLRSLTEEMR